MDDATWLALATALTVLGGVWTVHAFRSRGVASGLRGAGLTLIPPAAYLTGTLRMFTEIGQSVTDWATHLAFSPKVWLGVICAGLAVLFLFVSGALRERGRGGKPGAPRETDPAQQRKQVGPAHRSEPVVDDDLADIEAILKKRGIT